MADPCEHVDEVEIGAATPSANGCEECLASGSSWVHLRFCMTCGHVGCCDSSPNRHATAHFHEHPDHPLIRSFQPDEDWWWCYVDEVGFEIEGAAPAPSYDATRRALPHKVDRSGGERLAFGGMEVVIRASAESTGGAFSICEEIDPVDAPMHIHHHHDELFYVLEGDHVFTVGGTRIPASPGDLVFGPRGVPHAQERVVPRQGRILTMFSPAGFEGFFRDLAAVDAIGGMDEASLDELARRYGATWV